MAIVWDFTVLRETYNRSAISATDRWVGQQLQHAQLGRRQRGRPEPLGRVVAAVFSSRRSAADCRATPTAPGVTASIASTSSRSAAAAARSRRSSALAGEGDARLEVEPRVRRRRGRRAAGGTDAGRRPPRSARPACVSTSTLLASTRMPGGQHGGRPEQRPGPTGQHRRLVPPTMLHLDHRKMGQRRRLYERSFERAVDALVEPSGRLRLVTQHEAPRRPTPTHASGWPSPKPAWSYV